MGLSKKAQGKLLLQLLSDEGMGPVLSEVSLIAGDPFDPASVHVAANSVSMVTSGDPADPYLTNDEAVTLQNITGQEQVVTHVSLGSSNGDWGDSPHYAVWGGRLRDGEGQRRTVTLHPYEQITFGVGKLIARFEEELEAEA